MPSKLQKRICPACKEEKMLRPDVKTCGCLQAAKAVENSKIHSTVSVTGNGMEIDYRGGPIHTLEALIEKFEIDTNVWQVERFVANKWEVVMKPPAYTELFTVTKSNSTETEKGEITNTIPMWQRDKDNTTPLHENLYQVKAFFKRKSEVISVKQEIEDLMTLAKQTAPTPKAIKKPANALGGMLEINLIDHHFGKMAWGLETLGANYDVKIAVKTFNRALDTLINRSPFSTYQEIWFVVGNDLLNADNIQGTTTAGTQVESDFRHEKTYVTVRTLLVQAIENKLRHIANKVKVIVVPGNHDRNATWHLGDSLELYFSKYDDVEVDNQPSARKYHVYGNTLIGYAHGDKAKGKNLPLLMATEARQDFGRTLFHEWHTGHKHQSRTEEFNGVRVRILPALCPSDAWHAEMGFVGNLRSSEAFVWDVEQGLIGIVIYTDSDDLIEKASVTPTAVQ